MARNVNPSSNPGADFYNAILDVGASFEKKASADTVEGVIDALQNSGLTEDQLESLAGEIDEAMQKTAEPTEENMLDNEIADEVTDEPDDSTVEADNEKEASISSESMLEKLASAMTPEGENIELGISVLSKVASALVALADENDIDLTDDEVCNNFCKMAAESIMDIGEDAEDADSEEDEDVSEEDVEALAAEYDEAYEKLAAGYSITDYAYAQVENEDVAAFVGENAEKLAAVSGLNPLMVADDLLLKIGSLIPEE